MANITNLITNPSFENGSAEWSGGLGNGGAVVDPTAPFGTHSFELQNMAGGQFYRTPTPNLEIGKTYMFSFYGRNNGGTSLLELSHDSVVQLSIYITTQSWQRYSGTFVATANTPADLALYQASNDTSVFIDGLVLTERPILYDFFEGTIPNPRAVNLLSFLSEYPVDKVVGSFDLLTASRSVSASTLSGGFYLPKSDTYTIANPYGKKAMITMVWSIDGTNYYPQKPWIYHPGTPVATGLIGATMGAMVDDNYIYFKSVHYLGATVNYSMKYVLDYIDV